MGKGADHYTGRLAKIGKLVGDHSMKGGEKAIKVIIAGAAVVGSALGYLLGKKS